MVEQAFAWYEKFRRARVGESIDEVVLYTVPVALESSWKSAIALLGDYIPIGLSALYNTPSLLLLALVPRDVKLPEDYRLVRILKSKKSALLNERRNMVSHILIIEEWEYVEPDYPYLLMDMDFEKARVKKIFEETLPVDEHDALAFQSPVTSAPYVPGGVGGVSLVSFSIKSTFAREFVKTIQLMVPPEYRSIPPPSSVYRGYKFPNYGLKFHLAERSWNYGNYLSGLCSSDFDPLEKELKNRAKFQGEYSIFSTLIGDRVYRAQYATRMSLSFAKVDVPVSRDIDWWKYIDNVDLSVLRKEIDESLWAHVVHARHLNPAIESSEEKMFLKYVRRTRNYFRSTLEEYYGDTLADFITDMGFFGFQDNFRRVAQSIARSEGEEKVKEDHLKEVWEVIGRYLDDFVSDLKWELEYVRERRITPEFRRYLAVQVFLLNNPWSTVLEIWEGVEKTGLFRDIHDLQRLMDWLHEKGKFVVVTRDGKYSWIG
ncbi:hypothetical protein [Geoglobus ahangari]